MNELSQRLRAALENRYAVEREIGAGGMATVFLARDLRHRRPVAIKVVRPELGGSWGFDRFLREIQLAARLQHPHILPVFDSGVAGGDAGATPLPWFVMPFVEGETLRQRLQREGALPVDDAVTLAGEVADALAYAHAHGVVHRDVKPENILLSGGHAVVADFGVAKALDSGAASSPPAGDTQLTAVGLALGTPQYMSPEQATGRDVVDARADQYSLGCVLYEMLTGGPPFTGSSAQSIIALAMTAPRPRPSRSRPGVPVTLDQVVTRAMAANPTERYPDMAAFAAALRRARAPDGGRGRSRWAVGATVALAAVAGAGWLATRATELPVTAAAETIAVMPFSASGPGVELLGEGMVDLLSTNFDGVAGIRSVDPGAVVRGWGERGGGDRLQRALALGRELGAGSVVMGRAVSTGQRVRLAADLYSTTGEQLGRAQVDGSADSVLQLVDRLSLTLLREVWRSREPLPSLDIGSLTTDSIAALRAFLEGEQHYRRLSWDSALAAYTRATEVDSSFALAHLRRALVFGWTGGYGSPDSRVAGAAAGRFASRLPPRQRQLLQAYALFVRGKPAAVDSVRAFVQQHPESVDGWFLLGESLYHTREYTGASPQAITSAFDSVLRRDSLLVPAVIHPLELVLLHRDSARFGRYFRVLERASSPRDIRAIRTAASLIWGEPPSHSALLAALATSAPPVLLAVRSHYGLDEATSDSIVRLYALIQPPRGLGRAPDGRDFAALALAMRGDVLAGLGRLREARVLHDSLALLEPDEGTRSLRWPVALAIDPGPEDRARYDSVAAAQPATAEGEYLRAAVGLALGRVEDVRRRLDERLRTVDTLPTADGSGGLVLAVAGWSDLMAGDTAQGLRRLRDGLHAAASPQASGHTALLRFQQALALSSQEESRGKGMAMLRYGFDSEPLFLPLTHLALGRAYEAAGQRDSAALAYGRFLRLWDKADPVLAERVLEAREALQRLSAEPRPLSP